MILFLKTNKISKYIHFLIAFNSKCLLSAKVFNFSLNYVTTLFRCEWILWEFSTRCIHFEVAAQKWFLTLTCSIVFCKTKAEKLVTYWNNWTIIRGQLIPILSQGSSQVWFFSFGNLTLLWVAGSAVELAFANFVASRKQTQRSKG